jgi:hypothetical protein
MIFCEQYPKVISIFMIVLLTVVGLIGPISVLYVMYIFYACVGIAIVFHIFRDSTNPKEETTQITD